MSDRGYIALSLEIQAKAIEARIKGVEAERRECNDIKYINSDGTPAHFSVVYFKAEAELNTIASKIRELAP